MVGRAGADEEKKTIIVAGENVFDFIVPLFLDVMQIGRNRLTFKDLSQ
jgi:hypothetical protein